jgi:hypothetical protein
MGKKTIQGVSTTEFILRDGRKHAHFSHADKDVCAAKLTALKVSDAANGLVNSYAIFERTVSYPDLKEYPQGEDSRTAAGGVVTEKEVAQ